MARHNFPSHNELSKIILVFRSLLLMVEELEIANAPCILVSMCLIRNWCQVAPLKETTTLKTFMHYHTRLLIPRSQVIMKALKSFLPIMMIHKSLKNQLHHMKTHPTGQSSSGTESCVIKSVQSSSVTWKKITSRYRK